MIIASIYPCPFDVQDRHEFNATLINKEIKLPLSDLILDEKLSNDEHITIDFNKNKQMLNISIKKSKIKKKRKTINP